MGKLHVSECQKGQRVFSGTVVRSLSHDKPSHWINELIVVSPEHSLVEVGSSKMVINHPVFATRVDAIEHCKSLAAGYIAELEAVVAELEAKRLELVPIGKVA